MSKITTFKFFTEKFTKINFSNLGEFTDFTCQICRVKAAPKKRVFNFG